MLHSNVDPQHALLATHFQKHILVEQCRCAGVLASERLDLGPISHRQHFLGPQCVPVYIARRHLTWMHIRWVMTLASNSE